MLKYSLGIDVSKASFHACISTIDIKQAVKVHRSGSFSNNERGFNELLGFIASEHKDISLPLVVIMEATGIYHERLAMFLYLQHFAVSIVLPNKAKSYIASTGTKTKNDSADAKALSRMGAERALQLWEPMGEFFYTLRGITRQYQRLQQIKTMLCNQGEAIEYGAQQIEAVTASNKAMIASVDESIAQLQKAISQHLASDKEVARKITHLTSITGVGELTVAVVLAETNGFALFNNNRQLISYCGYDVVDDQSGTRVGKTKISKKGNSRIRRCLHMPAMCVVRWKVKVFGDLQERIYERTGVKMKGYVAVQKKLLTIFYTLWKNNTAFDDQYWNRANTAKTTSDGEAGHSSRYSSPEENKEAEKKLAPHRGRAKQGMQPSDGVGVRILSV